MSNFLVRAPEDFAHVFASACAAGVRAAAAVIPPLMMVTDPNRIHPPAAPDRVQGLWFVPEGPAGMAMIVLHPANGRCARWLLRQGHAQRIHGRRGAVIFTDADGQSIHRAAAYAIALVSVIEHESLGVRAEIVLRYS